MTETDIQKVKRQFRIFGDSPLLNKAIEIAIRVAKTDASVLIVGESGAGKDVFSRIIHQNSDRKQKKYIAVNCAAIPEGTIESELFGHVKGSFTGAERDRKGYFAEADKGTIFLDEVGELPYTMQAKLLRVLENGEFLPVGASSAVKVDVRIIAATNVNLLKAVEQGRFRSDLYYRLNQININVPSLRERQEDIPILFRFFCSELADKYNIPRISLTPQALEYLKSYPWRGNVRELKNIAERMSLLEMNREVDIQTLKTYIPPIERLPVLFKSEEASADASDIISIVLQNKKDIEELKEEIVRLKSVVLGMFNSSTNTTMINPPSDNRHSEQKKFDLNIDLPCSYEKYCGECSAFVAEETLESYRIVDSSKKLLQRFENGDKQVVVEYQETDESGRRIWLQKTVLMSQDTVYDRKTKRESVVVHGMILFRDTSEFHSREEREKIQLQDAFRAADSASRAKTEFMNRMSHDVRTPINGIMGMLDIIRKNRQDEAKVDDCLDKINLSASHLLALVNDVLDMNKLESGKETIESVSFDLTHLMDDVASLVNAQITEMGITHCTHRGELTHTRLIGSPLRLRQIMLNLFSNAIKYNKPGGMIDTYAGEVSCDGTRVVYEFRIMDSGIGMSSEFIEKELFHPFTQEKSGARTQYKGTGLGMSIVKELIEKMQGTIEVTSQQGVGTTYVFRLPFYIDCEGQRIQEVKTRIAGKELVHFHVLLVEDNEINMEIAEFYLTDHGATVEEAWNGREAVEKYAANPQKFDVILMDLMMPVMGGLEAAQQIRAMELPEAKQVPIIPMTAQSSEESKEGCRAAGMNSHLTKPIEPDSLVQTILETTEHAFGK